MTKRIFKAICTAALAVFLVTMLLIFGVLYEYFTSVQKEQLRTQTALVAQGVEQLGQEYFEDLEVGDYRLTWIDADGSVLYDSASDSEAMENHLERSEIQQALSEGYGESVRYSDTLMQSTLYCAQLLEDGTVLRLSVAHSSVLLLLIGMARPILIRVVVALVLAFVLASRLSKRIIQPLNKLNLEEPLENEGYDEIAPLLGRIHSQQQQLKRQQAALAQRKNELETIIGGMEEGMLLLDSEDRVLSMNPSARRLLDASDACLGRDILTVSRNPQLQQAVEQAGGGSPCAVQTSLHGRDIRIRVAPVPSEEGISGLAIVLFDVTEQEQAEQRRREFTANVSHELKTPLHAISGYSELLKQGIAKPEDVQPFAEKIYGEAQRLIALVEDIISLSHLDEGGRDLQWTQVSLYDQARQVVQNLSDVAQVQQVELRLEGEGETVQGVPELVYAILYNLCDNAVKYNHPGGSVTVALQGRRVTVTDTGIGIPPEHLDRIFERFYRVEKSRSKAMGGTGLGLSIVKHAARSLNAQLHVESTVGQGTAVSVDFAPGPEETQGEAGESLS
ncbi:MAG: ATP-binding protein [Oscillospiraceae bacterium]|nr:ATP-binding protein [Oscillospiraceae bacterium]